ncbi:hypothetical protein KKA53_00335 [Candidatus Dependentiae bacterium]|nr:hypothetical protein [Candidatus Dependentiae bacterium]
MKKVCLALLLFISPQHKLFPKFFKKLHRSVTKRLKDVACETIPPAQLIRKSRHKRKNQNKKLDQILQESQILIEQLTQTQNPKISIEQEETIQALSVKLLTYFLQEKISQEKKERLKQELVKLDALKQTIELLKSEN